MKRTQSEHEAINAREYPGTRQLCVDCDEPTERCEDDDLWVWQVTSKGGYNYGPLCPECYHKYEDE